MKLHAIEIANSSPLGIKRQNLLREYLQAEILYILQRSGAFLNLVFLGGTALRFLFQLPRYSIDLDFSLENDQNYNFLKLTKKIENSLNKAGYRFTTSVKEEKIVQYMIIRFEDVLQESGLSTQPNQKLSIKLEIDTNPPAGATMDSSIIRKHFFLHLWHHQIYTLFSGKIHALLTRKWTKGRDIYDIVWYLTLTNPPEPNIIHLNNALKQTKWDKGFLTLDNWKKYVVKRLSQLKWENVIDDARDFLENPEDVDLLTRENVMRILGRKN